jgi:o-succinylbenzoate synthase
LQFALDGLRADLHAKLDVTPLHRYLNTRAAERIGINAVIGGTHPEQTYSLAEAAIQRGFRTLKFKVVDPTAQIEIFMKLKSAHPSLRFRFDANGGWSTAEASAYLNLLALLEPEYLEQPLPLGQERAMANLQAHCPFALAADESLRSAQDGDHLLKLGAAKVWILKPSLIGSFRALIDLIHKARSHSIRCVLTTSLESGIGRRVIAALVAAYADPSLDHGLGTGSLLEGDLMPDDPLIRNGYFYPDTVSGIGTLPPESIHRMIAV